MLSRLGPTHIFVRRTATAIQKNPPQKNDKPRRMKKTTQATVWNCMYDIPRYFGIGSFPSGRSVATSGCPVDEWRQERRSGLLGAAEARDERGAEGRGDAVPVEHLL
jgi:hypothetical protein